MLVCVALFDLVMVSNIDCKDGVSDNGQESTEVGKENLSQFSRQRARQSDLAN